VALVKYYAQKSIKLIQLCFKVGAFLYLDKSEDYMASQLESQLSLFDHFCIHYGIARFTCQISSIAIIERDRLIVDPYFLPHLTFTMVDSSVHLQEGLLNYPDKELMADYIVMDLFAKDHHIEKKIIKVAISFILAFKGDKPS
jgi:hypothetical protein